MHSHHQPSAGLLGLPSLVLGCVLDGLDAKSALSFALTCRACTAGFAEHRLSVAKKCVEKLMPTVSCLATKNDHKYIKFNLTICLEWKSGSAMRKMYALSKIPGALDALWAAAWQVRATRLNNCLWRIKLTDLLKYKPRVCWLVVVRSDRFLQLPFFWLQDDFLGAAATIFAHSTGCHQQIVHVELHRPSEVHALIMRKKLQFDKQSNCHVTVNVYGSWWSSLQTYLPPKVMVRSQQQNDENVVVITGAWCEGQKQSWPAVGDQRSPQDDSSWAKNKLPFFGRSTLYYVDNELAEIESMLGVKPNTYASLFQ